MSKIEELNYRDNSGEGQLAASMAKIAFILDFDDTIIDTGQYKIWQNEFRRGNFSTETNARLDEYIELFQQGKFRIFKIQNQLSSEEWSAWKEQMNQQIPELLFLDARNFIEQIDDEKADVLVLTFGDREFQEAKVEASGLALPVIYTEEESKANVIRGWWNGQNYEINGQLYREVVLVDDKARNFQGFGDLPEAKGYLIMRQSGDENLDLPPNVAVISNFDEIKQ